MTVGELKEALAGVRDSMQIHVDVEYTDFIYDITSTSIHDEIGNATYIITIA